MHSHSLTNTFALIGEVRVSKFKKYIYYYLYLKNSVFVTVFCNFWF